jgi:hypothetical protein
MCTKNTNGEYCMKKYKEDTTEATRTTVDFNTLTCETPVMKDAVALGT